MTYNNHLKIIVLSHAIRISVLTLEKVCILNSMDLYLNVKYLN